MKKRFQTSEGFCRESEKIQKSGVKSEICCPVFRANIFDYFFLTSYLFFVSLFLVFSYLVLFSLLSVLVEKDNSHKVSCPILRIREQVMFIFLQIDVIVPWIIEFRFLSQSSSAARDEIFICHILSPSWSFFIQLCDLK